MEKDGASQEKTEERADRGDTDGVSRVLVGGGEVGDLMRSIDWAQTPVGPVDQWPSSLRTMVNLALGSEVPIFVLWGPELVQFYNHGAMLVLGSEKHPAAMGQRARDCWKEVWEVIFPMYQQVLAGGATTIHNGLLVLERNGFPEECYFDYAYTPIREESGAVAGICATVAETTGHVISLRRLTLLRELSVRTALAPSVEEVLRAVEEVLGSNGADLPLVLLYTLQGESARLLVRIGLEENSSAAPLFSPHLSLSPWPLAEVLRSGVGHLVEGLRERLGELHAGPWPEPVSRAFLIPLSLEGRSDKDAVLVVGLSPRLPVDESYGDFLNLIARQIAAEVARVQALEQERQRAAQLAELDRQKTAFFSNVSHEFRTPLTLILGPTEDALASPARLLEGASLELVHGNAQRLLRLVNTLLEFARIEDSKTRASFQPTELAGLTAGLANAFESLITRAGLRLIVECPPLPEPIWVDPALWEKVVLNLVSNAFKFTLEGQITVRQRWTGAGVELTVVDTGIGIAESELRNLFERFYRVEGAQGRSHEGSGIGLSLVKGLVNLHGGQVTVASRLGTGTTFTITLPAGHAHLPSGGFPAEAESPREAARAAFVREAQRWGGPKETTRPLLPGAPASESQKPGHYTDEKRRARVLVVDDNADMRAYIQRVLAERFVVDTVTDGASALVALREHPPQLLVSDVMMPGLDGMSLTRELRADPRTRKVPILLLSARAGEEATIEGLAAGAEDYLVKPFSARELVARVQALLTSAQARAETEAERQKQHELFMQAPVAIAILEGPRHTFTFANPAYRGLVGGREVVGQAVLDALPELRGQGFDLLLDRVVATSTPFIGNETPILLDRRGTGLVEQAFLNFTYTPKRSPQGEVDGVLVSVVDVSPQVLARRQVEEASRLKDEFLTTVSHELRTPLTAMLGWVQMLRAGALSADRQTRALETIERNAKAQAQLIEDLLDMGRILSGKLRLEVAPLEMGSVVEAALETVRPSAEAKGIRLQPAIDSAGFVMGDTNRLQQVVWNLLANAIKFTPKGGRVQVLVQCFDSSVELTVADTGQGIAKDFQPHVFERFRQADGGITRTKGGLGLGLSIVQQLVELHGGTVSVFSEGEGRGASFTVRLPLAIVRRPGPEAPALTGGPSPAQRELTGLRLLVVDDEEDTREMLVLLLEAQGAQVFQASSAAEGRHKLQVERPDVLLSDVGMPSEDGYAFIESVRALPREAGGDVPAIALTAYARSGDRTQALAAGFHSHIAKPVEPRELSAIITALVRHSRSFQK